MQRTTDNMMSFQYIETYIYTYINMCKRLKYSTYTFPYVHKYVRVQYFLYLIAFVISIHMACTKLKIT